jgi:hypothetical protein
MTTRELHRLMTRLLTSKDVFFYPSEIVAALLDAYAASAHKIPTARKSIVAREAEELADCLDRMMEWRR